MKYKSTRDASLEVSFEEALCAGYAPDGGLFVPAELPHISPFVLQQWSKLDFPHLALSVLRLFISKDEIPDDDLARICQNSFEGFENKKQAVQLVPIGGPSPKVPCIHLAELFHGPTMCFKDLGMRPLVQMLAYFASKRQRPVTLIVSTTGDTGPAAVEAVRDAENPFLNLLVHYPQGQITEFQRRQLTTVDSPHVKIATFQGGGDDMDAPIKELLAAQAKAEGTTLLTGVNSYNIGRPLMQTVHFIWTYLRIAESMGIPTDQNQPPVDVVLPTGAMGNIVGAYMAKKMGVPIGKLNAICNINDITHRVFETGQFHRAEEMKKTLSEAINIQVPYNFERILYYATSGNSSIVKVWMEEMESTQKLSLPADFMPYLQYDFQSARITDEEMVQTMRTFRSQFKYLADPHTAVAICGAMRLGYPSKNHPAPTAIMATASPCKFQEVVTHALGEDEWNAYVQSDKCPQKFRAIMESAEVTPVLYSAVEGQPLSVTQKIWMEQAKGIIADFATEHSHSPPLYGPQAVVTTQEHLSVETNGVGQGGDDMPAITEVASELEHPTPVATPAGTNSDQNDFSAGLQIGAGVIVAGSAITEEMPQPTPTMEPSSTPAVANSSKEEMAMMQENFPSSVPDTQSPPQPDTIPSSGDAASTKNEESPQAAPAEDPWSMPALSELPPPQQSDAMPQTSETSPAVQLEDPWSMPAPSELPPPQQADAMPQTTEASQATQMEDPWSMPPPSELPPPEQSSTMPQTSVPVPLVDSPVDDARNLETKNDSENFMMPPPAEQSSDPFSLPSPDKLPSSTQYEMPVPTTLLAPKEGTSEPSSGAVPSSNGLPAPGSFEMPPPAPQQSSDPITIPASNDLPPPSDTPNFMSSTPVSDPFAMLGPADSYPLPAADSFGMGAPLPTAGTNVGVPESNPPSQDLAMAPPQVVPPIVATVSSDSEKGPEANGNAEVLNLQSVMSDDPNHTGLDQGQSPADPVLYQEY